MEFCHIGSKHTRAHFYVPVSVPLLTAVTKYLQKQLEEGSVILAYSLGGGWDMIHYGGEVMEAETWTHYIHSGSRGR